MWRSKLNPLPTILYMLAGVTIAGIFAVAALALIVLEAIDPSPKG
jgi:hypothetical protein